MQSYSWRPALLVSAIAAFAVFVLPLFVPVPLRPTISASYVAGFNNTAAIAATVAISVTVFVLAWLRRGTSAAEKANAGIGAGFVAATIALTAIVLGLAGWIVIRSHAPYLADAGYFIEVATARRETGLPLYTGLEFAYGPLLLLPEVWLSTALRCSMQVSYFVMLVVDQAIGLLFLAYVLHGLPMTRALRRFTFALVALGCISPILGINYTLIRFATPLAAIALCGRLRSWTQCMVLAAATEVLVLLISPEMGAALAVGLAVLFLLRIRGDWRWACAAVLPLLVLAASFASIGRPYLRMIAQFSRGTLNIPVGPYPHLLVFLFAVVWVVPCGLAGFVHAGNTMRGTLLACYALGLAMLPAALGRCDPLHVFLNGLPLMLLSCVAASTFRRSAKMAWCACFALLVGWQFYVNASLLQDRTAEVFRLAFSHPALADFTNAPTDAPSTTEEALYRLDLPMLNGMVGKARVATPAQVSPDVIASLVGSQHYSPGFYSFGVDCMNPTAEARRIRDMNQNAWALLPRNIDPPLLETTSELDGIQGFILPYPHRHANPTNLGDAFQQNIDDHWIPVRPFGPYVLMRQK